MRDFITAMIAGAIAIVIAITIALLIGYGLIWIFIPIHRIGG